MVSERGCRLHQEKLCYQIDAKKVEKASLFDLSRIFLFLIDIYQKYISVLLPKNCRFYPTCSEYAKQAFIKHRPHIAIIKTIYRIFRCNPLSAGGYDPV
jgi:uncharacterized protein